MPSFQRLIQAGQKRRHESSASDSGNRKRVSVGATITDADGTIIADDPTKAGEQYWMVQWRNPQYKKHKTWDGDGVLVLSRGKGVLYDLGDARIIATGKPEPDGACIGTFLHLSGKEMEVECSTSKEEFVSGRVFGCGALRQSGEEVTVLPMHESTDSLKRKFTVPFKAISVNVVSRGEGEEGSNTIAARRQEGLTADGRSCWSAHWRRPQGKKHKTWDGDSFVVVKGNTLEMISEDGKLMGQMKWKGEPLKAGSDIRIGSKIVELEQKVHESAVPKIISVMAPDGPTYEDCDDLETAAKNESCLDDPGSKSPSVIFAAKENIRPPVGVPAEAPNKKFIPPNSFYAYQRPPMSKSRTAEPLHDPNAEGAVVMKAPTKEHHDKYNQKNRAIVPVVIDPVLARHLRPHQKEGVKFMYECVMGLRKHEGQGCILADEMGMGKTLQTITLIWTLLKQNCYVGSGPAVGKVLIVCPVSLIVNWKKEFNKWLGKDRVKVLTGDKDKKSIRSFLNPRMYQVLIIGYERLRTVISDLSCCVPPIGLVICDEGHRLKSANNKTSTMFEALRTPRRIILSGTPIQNDLSEFHAMADFCNPGLLDEYSVFRKVFEIPILKSRAPGCSTKELEIGEARQAQLQAVARSFVLRRDSGILTNYLPPKHEYVVFVTPSPLQKLMFAKILQPETLSSLIHGSMARSLAMIQLLIKLSNSPALLKIALEKRKDRSGEDTHEAFNEALKLLPVDMRPQNMELSGKLCALSRLLAYLRQETDEKCIIVSHYTSTLNVIEQFAKDKRYNFLRLDGQTPVAKRQEYVDRFNKAPQSGAFIFLLSAKAGGVGLNLIGASRLCLIDSDWNPSHDLQSMARIHRDGQKRPVFIYRFLTAGTIDEKIYQRQVTKLGLSDSLMGKGALDNRKSKSDSFTNKELRDLFTFHQQTSCHTHELLGCPCVRAKGVATDNSLLNDDECTSESDEDDGDVRKENLGFRKASLHKPEDLSKLDRAFVKKKKEGLASLGEWKHLNCLDRSSKKEIHDEALQQFVYASFDSEAAQNMDVATHTLPDSVSGGSVCFLFEKMSDRIG